jgi:hypothetical protein
VKPHRSTRLGAFLFSLLCIIAFAVAAVPQSNQAVDINSLIANMSGNFTWASTAPTSAPTGQSHLVSYAQYKSLVVNTTASPCPYATATGSTIMTWSTVISCASTHTASMQTETVSFSESGGSLTESINPITHVVTCTGVTGAGTTGTPIVLPAGTVAPSSSTPISISISGFAVGSGVSATIDLLSPSGGSVLAQSLGGSTFTRSFTGSGVAGSWEWEITETGGVDASCPSTAGTGTFFSGTATVTWFQ